MLLETSMAMRTPFAVPPQDSSALIMIIQKWNYIKNLLILFKSRYSNNSFSV